MLLITVTWHRLNRYSSSTDSKPAASAPPCSRAYLTADSSPVGTLVRTVMAKTQLPNEGVSLLDSS
jgi:hypothetical protein